jgi:hypothetical protein
MFVASPKFTAFRSVDIAPKLGWFKVLKASQRTCSFSDSAQPKLSSHGEIDLPCPRPLT